MSKFEIDGKSVEIYKSSAMITYLKPNGERMIVDFYYSFDDDIHSSRTSLNVSVYSLKPRKLSSVQKTINKLRPNTYNEEIRENIYKTSSTVSIKSYATMGGAGYSSGCDDNFGESLKRTTLFEKIPGEIGGLVRDAHELAIKVIDMPEKAEQTKDNISQMVQKKKVAEFFDQVHT